MKAKSLLNGNNEHGGYVIECPGCKRWHLFDSRWKFNGDLENPTFSPSMLVEPSRPQSRCHSFVENGKIRFLDDCYHELKGQTVDLPELNDSQYE